MTFVYEFDPEEMSQDGDVDFSPFAQGLHFDQPMDYRFDSPVRLLKDPEFNHSVNEYSVRVINTFNRNKRVKISEPGDCNSRSGGDFTNDHTNIPNSQDLPVCNEAQKVPELAIKNNGYYGQGGIGKSSTDWKKRDAKKEKSQPKTAKRRKRKGIVVKRDQYRKRKDVLMKGVLRKCRKYFQEQYTVFARSEYLKNMQNTQADMFNGTGEFIEETPMEVDQVALAAYCAHEFRQKGPRYIMYYLGAMIYPQEFKTQILNEVIKPKPASKTQTYLEICDLVYEVLYKFSYQKLDKFCSIPSLAYLFLKFHETAVDDSEIDQTIADAVKEKCRPSATK